MLLKMVVEYCQCVDDIPAVTPDLLNRIIELLKVTPLPSYFANHQRMFSMDSNVASNVALA